MAKTKEMKIAKKAYRKAKGAQRTALNWFAEKMLAKLELRGERAVKIHPLSDSVRCQQGPLLGQKKDHDIWWYYRRMKGEINELQGAIKRFEITPNEITRNAVISEACDCANFAAAIAEKAVEDTR